MTDRSRFVQESKLRQVEAKQLMMEISQKEAQIATEIKKWEQKQAWQTELVILERHFSIAERQFKELRLDMWRWMKNGNRSRSRRWH